MFNRCSNLENGEKSAMAPVAGANLRIIWRGGMFPGGYPIKRGVRKPSSGKTVNQGLKMRFKSTRKLKITFKSSNLIQQHSYEFQLLGTRLLQLD